MRKFLVLGVALALAALVRADGGGDSGAYTLVTAADRVEFERGEWHIVELIRRGTGNQDVRAQQMRLTYKSDKLTFTSGGGQPQTYEFKIDPNTNPTQLDWKLPTIGGPNAIYQMDRGTLKVAVPTQGKDRPRSFSDPVIEMVIIMKRVTKP